MESIPFWVSKQSFEVHIQSLSIKSATASFTLIKTGISTFSCCEPKYALYKQKSNCRNLLYPFCHVQPSKKILFRFYFSWLPRHDFEEVYSHALKNSSSKRQYSSRDLNSRETSADAVISNVWSVLDLLPSLWNFINSDIDWEKISLQQFTQLNGIVFFRDVTYSAEVILVMVGSFHE